jgi:adenylate cyclase class IV
MPRNIEIKARLISIDALLSVAASLADGPPTSIPQDDTFFHCSTGRLKLRAFSPSSGELIYYRRPDQEGPKTSFYLRSPTSSPDTLREVLSLAHGVTGRVRKHRTLFLSGRTRIHLDRVEDLGDFLELEVVLAEDESAAAGEAEAHALMERLGVAPSRLVAVAYVDLLRAGAASGAGTPAPHPPSP